LSPGAGFTQFELTVNGPMTMYLPFVIATPEGQTPNFIDGQSDCGQWTFSGPSYTFSSQSYPVSKSFVFGLAGVEGNEVQIILIAYVNPTLYPPPAATITSRGVAPLTSVESYSSTVTEVDVFYSVVQILSTAEVPSSYAFPTLAISPTELSITLTMVGVIAAVGLVSYQLGKKKGKSS